MSAQVFMDAMGEVNVKYVEEVLTYRCPAKRKTLPVWLKGGIVACLAVFVFSGVLNIIQSNKVMNVNLGGNVGANNTQSNHDLLYGIGGDFPEGVDPVISSIAVYPDTENVQDVADATMEAIDQDEALGIAGLSEYLPLVLPEGFRFSKADLYETIMNNGKIYNLLRVTYSCGAEQTGELSNAMNKEEDTFVVSVMNYRPRTEKEIYVPEQITEGLLEELGAQTFHVACADVFVGISPMSLQDQDVLGLVYSICSVGNNMN